MIIPIRCFTCGKPLASLWPKYKERVQAGEKPVKVLNDLDMKRYCCRTMFLTHRDNLEKIAKFRV